MSDRIAPQAYMGGNLLAGDIFQMLGLPSPGGFSTPLQNITDSVLGPGAFQNFQNAGTKKLLDVALKGVIGGKQPARRGRPRKAPAPKVCRHKYPNRCKCPKGEGAGIFDNIKDYVKLWEPEKVLGKIGDLALGKVVKHALGGSAIAARVNGFVADPQVQKDIHKLFANAMTEMLVKHEQAGGRIPLDHPIMMELGPAISGSGRRRMVAGSWTKWLNPLYLAKRALHATHIDRIINKIPVVGNVAAATGITGGAAGQSLSQRFFEIIKYLYKNKQYFKQNIVEQFIEYFLFNPQKFDNRTQKEQEDFFKQAKEFERQVRRQEKLRTRPQPIPESEDEDEGPQQERPQPIPESEDEDGGVGGKRPRMTKKERQAKYRAANREKLREKQRQYREAKKVKVI